MAEFLHRSIAGRPILAMGTYIYPLRAFRHVVFCVPNHPAFAEAWLHFGEPFLLEVQDEAIVYVSCTDLQLLEEPLRAKDVAHVLLERAESFHRVPLYEPDSSVCEIKIMAEDILSPDYRTLLPANPEALAYTDELGKHYMKIWR